MWTEFFQISNSDLDSSFSLLLVYLTMQFYIANTTITKGIHWKYIGIYSVSMNIRLTELILCTSEKSETLLVLVLLLLAQPKH